VLEVLDPQYARTALESLRLLASAAASLASRVGFDDSSRLRVRAEHIDDGFVRVRDASGTVDILEILREMSWTFYNLSQQRRLLENLDVALSTRASEGTLSSFSAKFPSAAALADNLSNPTTTVIGSALLAWDGTYWRRVAADSSSRLRVVAETVANPPAPDALRREQVRQRLVRRARHGKRLDHGDVVDGGQDVHLQPEALAEEGLRVLRRSWGTGVHRHERPHPLREDKVDANRRDLTDASHNEHLGDLGLRVDDRLRRVQRV
jgi:hypothetical protein